MPLTSGPGAMILTAPAALSDRHTAVKLASAAGLSAATRRAFGSCAIVKKACASLTSSRLVPVAGGAASVVDGACDNAGAGAAAGGFGISSAAEADEAATGGRCSGWWRCLWRLSLGAGRRWGWRGRRLQRCSLQRLWLGVHLRRGSCSGRKCGRGGGRWRSRRSRLERERFLHASFQFGCHRRRAAQLKKEGSPLGNQNELRAAAEPIDQPGVAGQRDEHDQTAGNRSNHSQARSSVEPQLDRHLRVWSKRPLWIDKSEPPTMVAGDQDEHVDPAVVGNAGGTMGKVAGAVVGVGAAGPKAGLKSPNWPGCVRRAAPQHRCHGDDRRDTSERHRTSFGLSQNYHIFVKITLLGDG